VIRGSLLRKHKARFIAVDTRLVQDLRFRFSINSWAPGYALYQSADIKPEQIDNLYSDVVFLKLTVLPDVNHHLDQLARRLWLLSKN
jgi:hypothetical protein